MELELKVKIKNIEEWSVDWSYSKEADKWAQTIKEEIKQIILSRYVLSIDEIDIESKIIK